MTGFKAIRTAGIVLTAGLLVFLVFLFLRDNFKLNRTVREAWLRMIQIETLSFTTTHDFRIVFLEDRALVDRRDGDTGHWIRLRESGYRGSVRNISGNTEFVFSRGKLSKFHQDHQTSPLVKYLNVDFAHPESSKAKGLIVFSSGAWHVKK